MRTTVEAVYQCELLCVPHMSLLLLLLPRQAMSEDGSDYAADSDYDVDHSDDEQDDDKELLIECGQRQVSWLLTQIMPQAVAVLSCKLITSRMWRAAQCLWSEAASSCCMAYGGQQAAKGP